MIDITFFTVVLFVFLRLITFFAMVPIFFPKGTPNTLKIAFTLIFSYILSPSITTAITPIQSNMDLLVRCVSEVTTGLTLGYLTNLCFFSARFAGNLLDLQVGFGMMTIYDPSAEGNITLIERTLYWFSLIVFLAIDGQYMLIRALNESFKVIGLGHFILAKGTAMYVVQAFIQFFAIGLKIAIPIILVLLICDLTMGLVARTVPQLNIMILGMPVKILIGLGCLAFALPIFLNLIHSSFSSLIDALKGLFNIVPALFIFASEEKTEEATPKKKSDARKKGQVAKSKEVGLALTLLASTLVLVMLGEYLAKSLSNILSAFLTNYLTMNLSNDNIISLMILVTEKLMLVILPVVVPIMVMGIIANFLQSGFLMTLETIKPQFSKLNPISGFKKIFSIRTVVELIKDIAVISIVGIVGYKFVKSQLEYILSLSEVSPSGIIVTVGNLAVSIFFKVTLVMIVIAIIDFIFQKRQYGKELRMTKQEIKEEYKQDEGDPQIKSKIRQKQREMASRRMMQSVPDATVVVTNPTHIAVALKYEEGKNQVPRVVAKGTDYVALKIKELAKENEVPIIENKPLARLIYNQVDLESEIPAEMYEAVAEILAVVFKLKKKNSYKG